MAFNQLAAKSGFGLSKLLASQAPKVSPIVLHHLHSDLPPFSSHHSFSSNSPPQLINGYRQFSSHFNDHKSSDYHDFQYAWTKSLEEARSNLKEARRNLKEANNYFDSEAQTERLKMSKERHSYLVQTEKEKLRKETDKLLEEMQRAFPTSEFLEDLKNRIGWVLGGVIFVAGIAFIEVLYVAVVFFGLTLLDKVFSNF